MTNVLIVSDSHGLTKELKQIKERHNTKFMIHCGDSELDFDAQAMEGYLKVSGNCDFDSRYPVEQLIEINGITIFITHGHLYRVKANLMTLSYRAEEKNARIVCFGHTHIAGAEKIGDQLFINPGSIRLPRNRREKTYAILNWDEGTQFNVHFYTVDGKPVNELNYKISM